MSKYLCLDCGNIFDDINNYSLEEYNYCPIVNCNGEIIELDDNMIYVIKTLNSKGYYTEYCCGGHAYDKCDNIYIVFNLYSMEVENLDFMSLPKNFRLKNNSIRYNKSCSIGINNQILINEANTILCEWVSKLKSLI